MIVVDTSVWIDHLRSNVPELAAALEQGVVLMHPFVRGELACDSLKETLPQPLTATNNEVMTFIERRSLMGRGIGYIDVHLLASAALTDRARLWTRDKRLRTVAEELDLSYE
ncbi:MAG: type II toxin-antitoxin system VapC family toxin [Aquisalimonadaceae bacterium]